MISVQRGREGERGRGREGEGGREKEKEKEREEREGGREPEITGEGVRE